MTTQWCDEHWAPFAAKQANGIAAQAFLMHMITSDERWLGIIDRGDGVSDVSPEGLNRAMEKIAPACCWISPIEMQALLIAATECNPVDCDHLDGVELARVKVEAFKMWQAKNRGEAS